VTLAAAAGFAFLRFGETFEEGIRRPMSRFWVDTDQLGAGQGHHELIAGEIGAGSGLVRLAAGAIVPAGGMFTPGERHGALAGGALGGTVFGPAPGSR
jgi:hypothetical protein